MLPVAGPSCCVRLCMYTCMFMRVCCCCCCACMCVCANSSSQICKVSLKTKYQTKTHTQKQFFQANCTQSVQKHKYQTKHTHTNTNFWQKGSLFFIPSEDTDIVFTSLRPKTVKKVTGIRTSRLSIDPKCLSYLPMKLHFK